MRKVFFAALATLTLIQGGGFADSCCNPCDACYEECAGFGRFYAYGDWLFWKVRRSDLDYALAMNLGVPTGGTFFTVNPAYESGWRIGGGYETCGGLDLQVRYTNYDSHAYDFQSVVPVAPSYLLYPSRPSVIAMVEYGPGLFAESDYHFDYEIVDIELGSITKDCGDSRTRVYLGAKLAFIDQSFESTYIINPADTSTPSLFTRERVDLDAYGLSAGFDYHRDLGYCLGFYTKGGFALLVGNYDLSHFDQLLSDEVINPAGIVNVSESCSCFVGELELGAGLDYLVYRGGCGSVVFSLGYEFQLWYNTDDFLNVTGFQNVANICRSQAGLSVDGLVLRLTAAY